MLIPVSAVTEPIRNLRIEKRLWHDERRHTPSLGCTACPERGMCGGLNIASPLFDCLSFCCGQPAHCDTVCRNKPEDFAARVREVSGFNLSNVPRAAICAAPELPALIPVLYHRANRAIPFESSPVVCLPLYGVIQRQNGVARFSSATELARAFAISSSVTVVLTGTSRDAALERWWSLGAQRLEVIRALRKLRIGLVTTPNYSLFIDQPRWDDMHSMKRIAIVHEEFLREGLPAALHLNARTERDWSRWGSYIAARPEVTHVAFEFATGAGWADRIDWQADQLIRLAREANRPLHLIVRGGAKFVPNFSREFAGVSLLETSAFMKTQHRQCASVSTNGTPNWTKLPTGPGESLDSLLAQNWAVISACHAGLADQKDALLQTTQ
jgi:hypothetical protein